MRNILRLIVLFVIYQSGFSALQPEQILILTNSSSQFSKEVAEYYCRKRKIPVNNILQLDLSEGNEENISRKKYVDLIQAPVYNHLKSIPGKYKCLVTTYGIPFKIDSAGRMPHSFASDETINTLNKIMAEKSKKMLSISNKLISMQSDSGSKTYSSWLKAATNAAVDFDKAYKQISISPDRDALLAGWLSQYAQVFGQGQSWKKADQINLSFKVSASDKVIVSELVSFINNADSQKWNLNKRLEKNYYSAVEKVAGLKGLLNFLKMHLDQAHGNETHSSVDSELSMVMFEEYPLYRWQPNELKKRIFWFNTKTIMVSRLDGPSLKIIKSLIDKSLQAEKKLTGKVYIDMRYPSHSGSSLYVTYDKSLKEMAVKIKDKSSMKVVEENTSSLFSPDSCPDTALYCGWYSLKKYIDAFDFVPGAVGYHIASFEAMDIRSNESSQWVPAMLRDGITATLGPVTEPYLSAFPKPDEFFDKLLAGDCLAEAYYKTKPFNSWQMLLIGDPLYRPF